MEVTSDAQERVWAEWTAFCKSYRVRLFLNDKDFETVSRIVTGFEGRSGVESKKQDRSALKCSAQHCNKILGSVFRVRALFCYSTFYGRLLLLLITHDQSKELKLRECAMTRVQDNTNNTLPMKKYEYSIVIISFY